jgi:hypothetical protein
MKNLNNLNWVIAIPASILAIYVGLNEISPELADNFLMIFIYILPLPTNTKIFFLQHPLIFAIVMSAILYPLVSLYNKLNKK